MPGQDVIALYLMQPRLWASYEPVEEYREHLHGDDLLPPGWGAYYRTWRPLAAGRPLWDEYTRAIYIRSHDTPGT